MSESYFIYLNFFKVIILNEAKHTSEIHRVYFHEGFSKNTALIFHKNWT